MGREEKNQNYNFNMYQIYTNIMANIWLFRSHILHMFALAENYQDARDQFKRLLIQHIDKECMPVFDELIEITRLNMDGTIDYIKSNIEFTDTWLKELGIPMDIIVFRE